MTAPDVVDDGNGGEDREESSLSSPDFQGAMDEDLGEMGGDDHGDEPEPATDDRDLDPDDVDVAEADISDDDLDGGLFSGTEDAEGGDEDDESDDEPPEFDDYDESQESAPSMGQPASETLENALNEGAARAAVVGLDDDEQANLEEEMAEVFESFRLGYFGAQAAETHILSESEDIDPFWGFVGAALVSGAFALHMRPDSEEQLSNIRHALGIEGKQRGDRA